MGKFWSALDWKMLIYFMSICDILQTFGIFYDHLLSTFCFLLVCTFFLVLVSYTKKTLATLIYGVTNA
jgi:hypothetical protein